MDTVNLQGKLVPKQLMVRGILESWILPPVDDTFSERGRT